MGDGQARYVTGLIEAFERNADLPAVIHRGRTVSYGELLGQVYRVARVWDELGIRHGEGVFCVLGNSPEALVVRLAAHVRGLWCASIAPEVAASVDVLDTGASAAVLEPGGPAPDTGTARKLTLGPGDQAPDLLALAARQPSTPTPIRARDNDICLVSYTAGTSGKVKGVYRRFAAMPLAHRHLDSGKPAESPRFVVATAISAAVGEIVLSRLRSGGVVELHDDFDAGQIWAAIEQRGPIETFLYAPMLEVLLDHPAAATADPHGLRKVIYGSAPISPKRLREAVERLGPVLTQVYAQTETRAVTRLTPEEHAQAVTRRPELLASAGKPIPGVDVEIRSEDGSPQRRGAVGEICVRSGSLMDGYWKRPSVTAQALRGGWLHTSDFGCLDDEGYLYLVGRAEDATSVNGHTCYPIPIERVLSSRPGVRKATVVGTGGALHAFVVPEPGAQPDRAELRAAVRNQLGAAHEPHTIEITGRIPVTATGAKPDKHSLRAELAE